MTKDNFANALHSFDHRVPFQRFQVELNSGVVFTIVHPEAISLRGDIIIYVTPDRRYHILDSDSVCQLMDMPAA